MKEYVFIVSLNSMEEYKKVIDSSLLNKQKEESISL